MRHVFLYTHRHCTKHLRARMSSTSRCCPCFQLAVAPLRQIVHVLKQLRPCHDAWCRIWGNKVWASALGESTNLLAHVNTDTSKLVLHLHAMAEILCKAGLLALSTLR